MTRNGTDRRSINGRIGLRVPDEVIETKRRSYMRKKEAMHRPELIDRSDYDIVMTYQLEYRGIANYYQLAFNMTKLQKLKRVMELSLLKTLANKHKTSMKKMRGKYKAEITVEDRKYSVLQVAIARKDKKPLVATWGGIPLRWNIKATLKEQPTGTYWGRSELVQRLLADCCELCGSSEKVEVHHIRAMKHLHEYPGRPKPEWVKRMIALKRKTLLLCRTCHMDVQYGRPLRRQIIKITEVKARQKERLRC